MTVAPASPGTAVSESEPFFSGGDWITGIVGVVASIIAWKAYRASAKSAGEAEGSRKAAERSAGAAEEAVAEQRRANDFAAERDRREQAEKRQAEERAAQEAQEEAAAVDAAAVVRAGRVTVKYSLNSGIDVIIFNGTGGMIQDLFLVDVQLSSQPTWSWQRNPSIFGGPKVRAPWLRAGAEHVVPIVFAEDGQRRHPMGDLRAGSLVRFTDGDGIRWEVGNGGPRRVPTDDSDRSELDDEHGT